jgi:beta-lactamase regulating signal transducer with metallopeptidase domain
MYEFLTTPAFKYVVYPLFGAVLGIALKYVSRNDQYAKFKADDLAVGLDLVKTACLTLLVVTTDKAASLIAANRELATAVASKDHMTAGQLVLKTQALSEQVGNTGWLIAVMLLLLWSVSTLIRKRGWKAGGTDLEYGVGIALPLVLGILSLIVVMAKATA